MGHGGAFLSICFYLLCFYRHSIRDKAGAVRALDFADLMMGHPAENHQGD